MKKLMFVVVLLFSLSTINANPIVPPSVAISELIFDAEGNWILELQGFEMNSWMPFDSIFIQSSTGKAKLKRFQFDGISNVLMVRKDSLDKDINIRQQGDSLILLCYSYGHYFNDYAPPFVFGDKYSALVASPRSTQSIAGVPGFQFSFDYSIDKSPTMGYPNDTTGMCGTLTGQLYDVNNQLIPSNDYTFYGSDGWQLNYNQSGIYQVRVLSKTIKLNSLQVYHKPTKKWANVPIDPVRVEVQPDSQLTYNLHLQKDLLTALNEVGELSDQLLSFFPNPVSDRILRYSVVLPVRSSDSYLEVIGSNGQLVLKQSISDQQGLLHLPATLAAGAYFIRLQMNNRYYSPTKILVVD
jgi:hypothetical protein